MSRLTELATKFYESEEKIKSLNMQIDNEKKNKEEILNLLLSEMSEQDLPEFAVDGINKRFSMKTDRFASYLVENKDAVFDAFRELGYDGIIKQDIHNKTLNSTIQELTDNGSIDLPEILKPYINVYERRTVKISKK